MRRYGTILMALLLVLAVSCYVSAQSIEEWASRIKAELGGSEITCAFATHPSTEAFQAMTAEFEQLTGIKVNWDVMEETYLKNKQLMDFAGGSQLYDVLMVDGFWISEYAPKQVIVPLSKYINSDATPDWFDYEDIMPAYRNGIGAYEGEIYGIPTAGETRFVGYRKDLFEKYGKTPPETLDELLELAQFFTGREPNLYGIAMRAQRGIHFASGWLTITYNFGDGFLDQKTWEPLITSSGTVESLKYFIELMKCAPPDVATYTHEEAVSAFMAGRTAMWFDATALVSWILDPTKSQVYDKVGFVPPPSGPIGDAGVFAGWNMAIASGSKNKDAAWAFITYMTSRAKAKEYVLHGGVPTRTSVYQDPELVARDPSYPVQLASFERANALVERGLAWIPPTPELGKVLDRVGYWGNMALIGEITPEEACRRAQIELEDIIGQ
ncbi:MAG TPA: sugar ABC transporter substrate-binding protein [Firmicutes bacterium]|nr:sugar ABC transporter substrate-binding protein [Bacillota bacterium]